MSAVKAASLHELDDDTPVETNVDGTDVDTFIAGDDQAAKDLVAALLAGLAGGVTVGAFDLDIPPQMYLARMQDTFELRHLFVGAEGTLGIVTAATLRLLPAATGRATAWVGLGGIIEARDVLRRMERAMGDALEGFEVVPAHCLQSVLAHEPAARAPLAEAHPWNALIECVSSAHDSAALREALETALAAVLEEGLISDAVIASSDTQAEAFWRLRDGISAAERALGPAMQHDISVPVERMPEFILAAVPEIEAAFPGTRAVAFGHLGDGNVHFHVLAPAGAVRGVWEEAEGKAVSAQVYDLVTAWGGSISAEHGIGQMKVDELARLHDPVALGVMARVKTALDPAGLLNPGKLVRPPRPD